MQSNGATTISTNDRQNYCAALFSNCIKTKNLKLGRALHSHLIKTALLLDTFFANRLIQMYSKCNSMDYAQKAFDELPFKNTHSWNIMIYVHCQMGSFGKARRLLDEMPEPNLVSYNSIISSFGRSGFYKEAISVFKGMQKWSQGDVLIDEFTFVSLTNACASLAALDLLHQVHGVAIVMGLDFNVVVCNALVDAYGKCGVPESSYWIFSRMEEKDVVSWTSMVVAYASASRLEDACLIFNQMPVRNAVSWTALIKGSVQNGNGERALSLFRKMQNEEVIANDITYVSVLSACADLALIGMGKQIHCRIIRIRNSSIFDNVFVVNALIDMYSKSGNMISSMILFERLQEKDIITWNSVITGFAQNGHGAASLSVFQKMIQENVRPNDVTFIGVLSACSHSGLESEALRFLDMMKKKFGLIPRPDHYAILVDLLGRKDRLKEALEVIEKAPSDSDHIGMWGAVLATCRVHGNLELAKRAAEVLFELEPKNTGRYVMLSNIYATAGRWDDAHRIRRLIDNMDLKKEAGSSWIEVKNARHMFVAEDMFQSHVEDIKELLLNLVNQMKDVGYMHIEDPFYLENDGVP
ncbi:pentatricopeptide repeat-containing protein At2g21090-like [Sesamum indicum]|uniref:Pentatricopeptide repeat-containing protein At2g21090-like n=1 Tax=Sesamum indicum TaxID=4182 RepID=A0A6I9UKV4_SESIN|nr:pentatricopeptide repeat-containing protein At2g21090-like [Sesamum indicum]